MLGWTKTLYLATLLILSCSTLDPAGPPATQRELSVGAGDAPFVDPEESPPVALTTGCTNPDGSPRKVVVSLTFDDTLDEYEAAGRDFVNDISWHAEHTLRAEAETDLPATFYVNRARIGHGHYLSLPRLQRLADLGHEIGGHTAGHTDLARIVADSVSEVRRQVCWDRNELTSLLRSDGQQTFDIWSFAYPFGTYELGPDHLATILHIVGQDPEDCGRYLSARAVSGVANTAACRDLDSNTPCDVAEVLPIADERRFQIRTPSSIDCGTPLGSEDDGLPPAETITGWLTQAIGASCPNDTTPELEQWWVPLVFHEILPDDACSADQNPHRHGIADSDFVRLSEWLRQRVAAGLIEVKTVHDALDRGVPEGSLGALPKRVSRIAVDNASMDDSGLNLDGFPARYQISGAGRATRVQEADNWYTHFSAPAEAEAGFFVRLDLNTSALRVTAPPARGQVRYYRVGFRHRLHEGAAAGELALRGWLRNSFLSRGGPTPAGLADGFEDGFWSSAQAYRPGGCEPARFTPGPQWQSAIALLPIEGREVAREAKDAMSFGAETLATSGQPVDLDLDDFEYCVCDTSNVEGVSRCSEPCELPTKPCP